MSAHRRQGRAVLGMLSCAWLGASAWADPYWIAYEGDVFPEEQGWWHIWGDEPADRWIEDGALVIDSLKSIMIADFYQMHLGGSLDPDPGELFIMEWRLRVDQVLGTRDPVVTVFSDDKWAVAFEFDEQSVASVFESGVGAAFEPVLFHAFELRSFDMRDYDLLIDGQLAMSGSFWFSLTASEIGWGDGVQGAASLSRWDYVRLGVVPESASLALFVCLVPTALRLLRARPAHV